MSNTYETYKNIADYILQKTKGFKPEIGIILGSGLSGFAKQLKNPVELLYSQIPGFLVSTAPGHEGRLLFGEVEGKKLVCMSGRFHSYEGYAFTQLALPVRILKLLGIEKLIVTNAAGGINENYKPGDVMIISDHIKFFDVSPMQGPNIEEFGPRFFDMTESYSKKLRQIAWDCTKDSKLKFHEGVYMFFPGPQFETPAEVRAARLLGGDAAGMSTVPEVITAAQMKLPVLGLSLISNMAAGLQGKELSSEEVNETAASVSEEFEKYVKKIIENM